MGLFETFFRISVEFTFLIGSFTWRKYNLNKAFIGATHRYSTAAACMYTGTAVDLLNLVLNLVAVRIPGYDLKRRFSSAIGMRTKFSTYINRFNN
jgi:hypothetical protein